ncbi:MAG: DUF2335 domain-containing protein, partial [Gemmataceae bacterium]|nr:DUF2335 domain-containing protein [Gemmataceae bacterium]
MSKSSRSKSKQQSAALVPTQNQSLPTSGTGDQESAGSVVIGASFQGPLPPPAILAQYNQVLDGAAERIFQMAEKQAAHRQ